MTDAAASALFRELTGDNEPPNFDGPFAITLTRIREIDAQGGVEMTCSSVRLTILLRLERAGFAIRPIIEHRPSDGKASLQWSVTWDTGLAGRRANAVRELERVERTKRARDGGGEGRTLLDGKHHSGTTHVFDSH